VPVGLNFYGIEIYFMDVIISVMLIKASVCICCYGTVEVTEPRNMEADY
jgi:hypothetical protein